MRPGEKVLLEENGEKRKKEKQNVGRIENKGNNRHIKI
jgi:hypothetical protein